MESSIDYNWISSNQQFIVSNGQNERKKFRTCSSEFMSLGFLQKNLWQKPLNMNRVYIYLKLKWNKQWLLNKLNTPFSFCNLKFLFWWKLPENVQTKSQADQMIKWQVWVGKQYTVAGWCHLASEHEHQNPIRMPCNHHPLSSWITQSMQFCLTTFSICQTVHNFLSILVNASLLIITLYFICLLYAEEPQLYGENIADKA